MNSLYIEKFLPYALAIVGAVLWWKFDIQLPEGEGILGSSLTLGAILTGFLATAKAILMTLDSPIMQRIRETSYINDLVSYLGQAIWLSFSFCIVSLIGFFVATNNDYYGLAWILLGLSSGATFIRVANIMLKVIKHTP